jgi:WhiB family redox-sensing transcriptional regulator
VADARRLPGPQLTHWDWQLAAACRGMASTKFFHPRANGDQPGKPASETAKKVCHACPVREHSLDHALKIPEPYGIWGGLSKNERSQRLGVQSLRYPGQIMTD